MDMFKATVTFSQIAVFNSNLDEPFNDWNEDHFNQGFAWRQESVSFKTLSNDEVMEVEFVQPASFALRTDSVRAITVPFLCNQYGEIEVATITNSHPIKLEPGKYQLVFETVQLNVATWCHISAVLDGSMDPDILIIDADLSPQYPLLMHAQAA